MDERFKKSISSLSTKNDRLRKRISLLEDELVHEKRLFALKTKYEYAKLFSEGKITKEEHDKYFESVNNLF